MNANEWVFWVGTVVALYDAVVSWAHVILYTRSNWRMYEEGQALMATMFAFALLLTYVGVVTLEMGTPSHFEGYPARGLIRTGIYLLLAFVISRWFYLLVRNQHRARRMSGERNG